MAWWGWVIKINLADVLDMRMRDRSQADWRGTGGDNVEGRKEDIPVSYCRNNAMRP